MSENYVRNGAGVAGNKGRLNFTVQPAAATVTKALMKKRYAYFISLNLLLFILMCIGFVGFSCFLYQKQTREMEMFTLKINSLIVEMNDLRSTNSSFAEKVGDLRKRVDELLTPKQNSVVSIPSLIQESESNKFSAIAIDNVEEYPEIEDINAGELDEDYEDEDDRDPRRKSPPSPPPPADASKSRMLEKAAAAFDNYRPPTNSRPVDNWKHPRNRRSPLPFDSVPHPKLPPPYEMSPNRSNSTPDSSQNVVVNSLEEVEDAVDAASKEQQMKNGCDKECKVELRKAKSMTYGKSKKKSEQRKTDVESLAESELWQTKEKYDEINADKSVAAAHYGGDSSNYNVNVHKNYLGNHKLQHNSGVIKDWKLSSPWFQTHPSNKNQLFYLNEDGKLIVNQTGVYFVYAQIFFSDYNDVNGYKIQRNEDAVLQCITSTYSATKVIKSNTCFTGGLVHCIAGDVISIHPVETGRHLLLERSKTFFGVFRVGEI